MVLVYTNYQHHYSGANEQAAPKWGGGGLRHYVDYLLCAVGREMSLGQRRGYNRGEMMEQYNAYLHTATGRWISIYLHVMFINTRGMVRCQR